MKSIVISCILVVSSTILLATVWAQPSSHTVNIARLQTEYRTVADIMSLIDQIKPDPERIKAYQATLAKPLPPADAFWFTKRDALLERMDAAESLGNIKLRLEAADAIMAIFKERKDINREMEFAFSYAGILREAGLRAKANEIEEEMVRSPQSYAHWVMSYHNRRSNEFTAVGNLEAAKPHYEAANTEYRRHPSYTTMPNTRYANHLVNARYKRAEGKYAEAEAHYLEALKATQNWVNNISSVSGSARHALPSNRAYSAYLGSRLDYVGMLLDLGRVQEAERIARQPLLWALEHMGKYSPHAVRSAAAYSDVLGSQGRHIEAEKLACASLEMAMGIGAEPDSLFMRSANRALARALLGQGRVAEADAAFQLVPQLNSGVDMARVVAAILNGRAAAFVQDTQVHAERVAVNIGAASAGSSALMGEARALHAMALGALAQDAPARQAAIAQFRSAVTILLASRQQSSDTDDAVRLKIREWMLQSYLALLAQQSGDPQSIADSFVVADWLRGSSTQGAVAASAARAALSDPQLATTVRREQDMRTELVSMHRSMQRLSTLSPEQLKESGEDPVALRARTDALVREHSTLFADIAKRFPKYVNLIQPQPPTIQNAQDALKKGEVLVSILTTPERSFVWAVPAAGNTGAGSVIFRTSSLGEKEIAPIVATLRSSVDVGTKAAANWPLVDVAASHRLYSELIGPLKAALTDASTLIVAANGSLAGLPPAMLVTAPHQLGKDIVLPFDRYAAVPWLDKQFATAQIPSVTALVSLRQASVTAPAAKAFTGFGDPVFTSQAAPTANATRGLRNAATTRPDTVSLRANLAVAWTAYSKLAPLPDTRDEVLAIASALGADPARDVVLGKDMTKQRVKQTDLSTSRIVAFATHGLIAGDFPGINQPSLALSVPSGKDADKEPIEALLTLEDVLQLKLNADWVVLSACNTAAADGQGGEAVSGLGRGFFYAGSKALLVTHWPVDSASAKDLVSHIFSAYAKDASLTRAKALQGAMKQVRSANVKDNDSGAQYSLAHPLFWAPYALVGEPGR
jgi:CHAT domain-containing protein/tetratricopeptide (TPR) repeat protein